MAVLVELVGVGGKDRCHVERVVFPPFETYVHRQVAPWTLFVCHVVRHAQAQLVDKADLLHARRVFVALDLHLKVVGQAEADVARAAASRHAVEALRERRIFD